MRRAVFTPFATIICVACHNHLMDEYPDHSIAKLIDAKWANVDESENGTCDKCSRPVYIERDDVALAQRFAKAVDIDVWQTGGMCVAAGFSANGLELVATDGDEDGDDIALGLYATDDGGCYRGDDLFADYCPFDEAVEKARYLVALMKKAQALDISECNEDAIEEK